MANKKKNNTNKTSYILKHPKLSASALVAKGKKEGVEIGEKYIWNIRSKAKGDSTPRRRPGRPPSKLKVNGSAREPKPVQQDGVEGMFVTAALDLGLEKAERLLGAVREAARSVASK